jgi:ethanolamine transporter EutH
MLVFGLISGGLVGIFLIGSILTNFKGGAWYGYSTMIIALSLVYVGVRNFRDKYNDGVISFGKALKLALGITLVASTIYVLVWLVEFYGFMPDFMEKYAAMLAQQAKATTSDPAALQKRLAGIESIRIAYRNPIMVVLYTYLEIVPVGIIISLLTALLLKRKRSPSPVPAMVV